MLNECKVGKASSFFSAKLRTLINVYIFNAKELHIPQYIIVLTTYPGLKSTADELCDPNEMHLFFLLTIILKNVYGHYSV